MATGLTYMPDGISVEGMDRPRASAGAKQLIAALEARGWSQEDLRRHIGVGRGVVSRWAAGERTPDLASALKLEATLGIPVAVWSLASESGALPSSADDSSALPAVTADGRPTGTG